MEKIIAVALLLSLAIFLFGFLLGNYIASSRIEKFKESQEMMLYNIIGLDVREKMMKDICDIDEDDLWKEKVELGRMLTALEERKGKDDKEVLRTKEIYEIIEIKLVMFLEQMKKECKKDFVIILFFYSNKPEFVGASEDQGLILNTITNQYQKENKSIYVFAFSIESQNPASRFLRASYGIKKAPSLVIEGELLEGFQTKQAIADVIDKYI
jgi:hypothetical protein